MLHIEILQIKIQSTSCNSEGVYCAEKIIIETESCLMPCEGMYVDLKKLPAENWTVGDADAALFIARYKNYKKFYDICKDVEACKYNKTLFLDNTNLSFNI